MSGGSYVRYWNIISNVEMVVKGIVHPKRNIQPLAVSSTLQIVQI